jgi:DNA helicase HerA-like ATPase
VSCAPVPFPLGVVVATQNPMDLDYRALSNAGLSARVSPSKSGYFDCEIVVVSLDSEPSSADAADLADGLSFPECPESWGRAGRG